MGQSASRHRQPPQIREEDRAATSIGLRGSQRSVRRSVSNFVRRRATSLSTRPKSWRRQSQHVSKENNDQHLDSALQSSKDDATTAEPSSSILPIAASPEPPTIVVQPASQLDALPPRAPSVVFESRSEDQEGPVAPSLPAPEPVSAAPLSSSSAPPAATAVPSDNRQFPPPGTLVLVQGVVHTTDGASRPPEPSSGGDSEPRRRALSTPLSAPRPSTADSDRRFNDLFTRPRPASTASFANPPTLVENTAPSHPTTSSPPVSEDTSTSTANTHNTDSSQMPSHTLGHTPGTSLSSNSVDVLGTLLRCDILCLIFVAFLANSTSLISVAAAATAASLLTGSSEHMQTSGLSAPRAPPHLPTFSPSSSGDNRTSPRNDRMRNAWGSLRERLGLRNSPSATPPTSEASSVDARERMITEMARAFNLGLGLNNETFDSPANSDPSSTPLSPPPAEGSFERFLHDLQADLRVALNEHDAAIEAARSAATPEYVRPEMPDVPDDVTTTLSHSTEEEEEVPESEGQPEPNQTAQTPARLNWWRLYRFPSIPAPASQTNSIPTSPLQETSRNSSSTAATSGSSESSDRSDGRPDTSASSTSPTAGPSNMVVPIIVVGLQSVNLNLNWPSPVPAAVPMPAPAPYIPTSREEAASSTSLSADHGSHDLHSFPTPPTIPSTPPLGESLPSPSSSRLDQDPLPFFGNDTPSSTRENVLEDFGTGLPSAAPVPTPPASDAGSGGARTFLIYVIGGKRLIYDPRFPTHIFLRLLSSRA